MSAPSAEERASKTILLLGYKNKKGKINMKKFTCLLLIVLTLVLLIPTPIEAKTVKKTDYQIAKELVKTTHKPIKLINHNNKKANFIISHRKGKNYIVVEKVISISKGGKNGYIPNDGYIAYNKKVSRNCKVTSYIIYAPNSNEFDEILWVVDNNTYR